VSNNTSKLLLSLSRLDSEIHTLSVRKGEIEKYLRTSLERIELLRRQACEMENLASEGASRQQTEEERMREESKKIVERRKQLSALGGVKGAKLVEREIDIASRVMQSMEEQALKAMEEAEQLKVELESLKAALVDQEESYSSAKGGLEDEMSEISKKLSALQK